MPKQTVGRYELVDEIGRGGMAIVYRAHDPRFRRHVAVKLMTQDLLGEPTLTARFEREAHTIASLEHPAIVPVYDFGEEKGRPFMVMRLMTGGTLSDRLRRGPMSITETSTILTRIGSALERAHNKGIIHRDLKPSNIMFDEYGDAYLADFGIARLTESAVTLTGESVIGTPAYMSPEQIHGDKEIDGRSDIYALGIICFEMLTGRKPYEDKSPAKTMMKHILDPVPQIRSVRPDLPPEIEDVIARSLAKSPTDRYASAGQLSDTLRTLTPIEQLPKSPADQAAATDAGPTVVDEPHPETEVITPAFAGSGHPDTEIREAAGTTDASPVAARPTPKPVSPPPELAKESDGATKWIIIAAVAGVIALILLAGLVGGGIYLANRSDETDDETPEAVTGIEETPEEDNREGATPGTTPDDVEEFTPETGEQDLSDQEAFERAEEFMNDFYDYLDREDYDQAAAALDQALSLVPDNPWYYHELAWLSAITGDLDAALEAADRAVELEPSAENYTRRAWIKRDLGDIDAALADHERAIELEPDSSYAHMELGITYQEMGDKDKALEQFLLARELDPDDIWYLDHLASFYIWHLEDYEQALPLFDEAIRREPEGWKYAERALVRRELGDMDGALADYEQAIALEPDEYWYYVELAMTYRDYLDDSETALAILNDAIQNFPDEPDIYAERAYLYHQYLDDLDSAIEDRNRAVEIAPEAAWTYLDRGVLLRDMGEFDRAIADFETAVRLEPENAWNYMELGYTYHDYLDDPEQGIEYYEQALEVDPSTVDAYTAMAAAYAWQLDDFDTAIDLLNTCIEIDPEFAWCYLDVGWMLNEVGDVDGAVTKLSIFIDLVDPDDCPECIIDARTFINENS